MTIVLIRDNRSVVPDLNIWQTATNYHINTREYRQQRDWGLSVVTDMNLAH